MIQLDTKPATLEDLYREPGKAELIGGRIVRYMSTGEQPSRIAGRIFRSLAEFAERTCSGEAFTDNIGFAVSELSSGRQSFSPDAAFFRGQLTESLRFIEGAPALAIEVRSECDYKPGADELMAAKRADYFAAGTLVVWDVDTLGQCIHAYRSGDMAPQTFQRGSQAHAEPAVPGWSVAVDWIFVRVGQ